jgi:hypothetical protein
MDNNHVGMELFKNDIQRIRLLCKADVSDVLPLFNGEQ